MCDYRKEVKEDILQYIKDEIDFKDYDTLDELEEKLNEDLWVEDSVTGNASGSYAEENVAQNRDVLKEALDSFGSSADYLLEKGAELADVMIRCYLLRECIATALEDIKDDFNDAHENM